MNIKKANHEDLKQLVSLYKEAFEKHNVFQLSFGKVLTYLETVKGDFIVAVEDGKVVGGMLITSKNLMSRHRLTRFRHIAVAKGYQNKGIGSALLKEGEKIVAKGKIEIHVSESETPAVDFYKKNGYEVEGKLKSHYRPNELCYIMGKVIR